ncbi:hypothetical protein [Nakamurella panacisegetis]|uniref:hypothetical protein n=1 Tax=Nakamurella panacisegetis TaxID=1090615 RepID=UPI0012FDC0C2|nr:hypothetical protein [Nakamurella panacisegetis]
MIPSATSPLAVVPVSGMNLSVIAGQAMISGYIVSVDAAATVAIAAATTVARTDLVILRVRDIEAGDATSGASVEVVTGVSTATPATPARSLVLARVAVGASVSSITGANLTDTRVYTASAGGLVFLPGALASAPTVPMGQQVYDSVANKIGVNSGTGWSIWAPEDLTRVPIRYEAPMVGGTIAAVGSVVGISNGITIAAKPYAQVLVIDAAAFISTGGAAADVASISARMGGTDVKSVRGAAVGATIVLGMSMDLAANTAISAQLIASKVTGTTSAGFTGNSSLSWMHITAFPA